MNALVFRNAGVASSHCVPQTVFGSDSCAYEDALKKLPPSKPGRAPEPGGNPRLRGAGGCGFLAAISSMAQIHGTMSSQTLARRLAVFKSCALRGRSASGTLQQNNGENAEREDTVGYLGVYAM